MVIRFVFKFIFNTFFLAIVLALVASLIIVFGRPVLGPGLPGSDNANFIAFASWIAKWLPNIPFWYPQQGAGVSFTTFYPILSHVIIAAISKVFSLNLIIVFRIYALVAVLLTSLGIYFLGLRLTKNQIVSGIAAVLYPLAPVTWIFLLEWGFFAEQASYFYLPPALIFLDMFLIEVFQNRQGYKKRICLLFFLISALILLLAHPLTFAGLVVFAAPFIILYPFSFNGKWNRHTIFKSVSTGIITFSLFGLIALFWVVPYYRYQNMISQGAAPGKGIISKALIFQNAIYPMSFFNIDPQPVIYESLDDPIQPRSAVGWRNVTFPIAISLLAAVGLIGSFFLNKKLFIFGVSGLFPLVFAFIPEVYYALLNIPVISNFSNWRTLIAPSRVIIPILAGFGSFTLAYLVLFPLRVVIRKIQNRVLSFFFRSVLYITSALLTLMIAVGITYQFRNWYNNPDFLISYGPESYTSKTIRTLMTDIRNIWKEEIDFCSSIESTPEGQLTYLCSNDAIERFFWPHKLNLSCSKFGKQTLPIEIERLCSGQAEKNEVTGIYARCFTKDKDIIIDEICHARVKTLLEQFNWENISKIPFGQGTEIGNMGVEKEVLEKIPQDLKARLDVTAAAGGILMSHSLTNTTPELGVYFNQSSLIPLMWNYQLTAFNSKSEIWSQPEIVDELAKYFGIQYALLSETNTQLEKFRPQSWERVAQNDKVYGILGLWRFIKPTRLAEATTKPAVLVIGQRTAGAYFRIFHLSNLGGLSFEEALIVNGGDYADGLSLEDLKNFDAVILDGYKYKNRDSAWKKLDKYVKEGGTLYINTGWQYTSADWQLDKTPPFFPLKKLDWLQVGMDKNFKIENERISGEIDIGQFAPLDFGGKPWYISTSSRGQLRDWAEAVLSVNDKLLVAGGDYGKGRVIWTGFDLAGHIGAYQDNPEEIKFFHNSLMYLLNGKKGREIKVDFTRNYPDRVEFIFNEDAPEKVALYWKEAFYKDFKATLVKNGKEKSMRFYNAGPGLTLFVLPEVSSGTKIIFEYKSPFSVQFARLISLVVFISIVVSVFNPFLINMLIQIVFKRAEKIKIKLKDMITSDED